jgi:hypothetical protein
MLVWALWLAASLVRAIGWGWRAFGQGGFWRRLALPRSASKGEVGVDEEPATSGTDVSEGEGRLEE